MRAASLALCACSLLISLISPTAYAQEDSVDRAGYDADIELIKPRFTTDILPGIDLPETHRGGTIRWGLAAMYTSNPLVLYEFDTELGPVVSNRFTTVVGASVDISRRFTARLSLPLYAQWGSAVPRYASDGFFVGDMNLGARVSFFRSPYVGLGIRADLALPTSQANAYAGERMPRLDAAFLAMFDVGRVRFALDAGYNARFSPIVTTEDFTLGGEFVVSNGVRVTIIRDRLAAGLSVYGRWGHAGGLGGAETSGEALLNVAFKPIPIMWLNAGAGRGFTRGYGSSDFRAYLGVSFQKVRPPKEEPESFVDDGSQDPNANQGGLQFNVRNIGQINAEGEGDLDDEPDWAEGELARVESEVIRIREAIRFKVGSAVLMEDSYPVLDYIARLMNNDARIAHLVIEGHSSEDGAIGPNYSLSLDRATSIWERLLKQGVHPARLSTRGMGEVMPAGATGDYSDLEASRRVVFHIVRQYEEWEEPPNYMLDLRYPWSGEDYRAVQPRMPSPDEIIGIPELERERPERTEDDLEELSFDASEEEEDIEFDEEADTGDDSASPEVPATDETSDEEEAP